MDLITPQKAYVLGAGFGIPWLEDRNRDYVVVHFQKWLQSPTGRQEWNTLVKWAEPVKVFELVRDATKQISSRLEAETSVLALIYPQTKQVQFNLI